jgi:catechol 2,3-dioxygenase-like lactoylglutathione lyase family enzyme
MATFVHTMVRITDPERSRAFSRRRPHRVRRRRFRRNSRAVEGPARVEPERLPYQVSAGGSRICFVRDPDGALLELISYEE